MMDYTTVICTKCDIPHVTNCHSCFGFGFVGDKIVSASEAATTKPEDARPCPECGGYLGSFVVPFDKLRNFILCEEKLRVLTAVCQGKGIKIG